MIPRRLFWFIDVTVVAAAFWVAYFLWPSLHRGAENLPFWSVLRPADAGVLPHPSELVLVCLVVALATVFFLSLFDAYDPLLRQSRTRIVFVSLIAPLASSGLLTMALYGLKRFNWSRLLVFSYTAFSGIALALLHSTVRAYLAKRRDAGFYAKNVLLVGHGSAIRWLTDYFERKVPKNEYLVCGSLRVPTLDDQRPQDTRVPELGGVEKLPDLLIWEPIHEVIVAPPARHAEWLAKVVEDCDNLGVMLRIIPEDLLLSDIKVLRILAGDDLLRLPAIVLAPPHFDSDALFIKRVIDIVVSATLLLVLLPFFAVVALLIKLTTPGLPIFYHWRVVGKNGVRFTGYKFTTMYPDADDRRKELLEKNEMSGPVFKIKDDPRVTPFGRFLRKYSLNELPQLWSVLKGDMSLVGPRPAFPHELDGYGFLQKRKLSVRPGITCLWQVRGRNRISNFDDWVKMDLEYIDNWSLWLDLKILARTAWAVAAGTGS